MALSQSPCRLQTGKRADRVHDFTMCTEAVHGNDVGQCVVAVSVGPFESKQRSLSNSGSTYSYYAARCTHRHTTLHHMTSHIRTTLHHTLTYTHTTIHTHIHTHIHTYITVHHITSHYIILHHSTPPCRHGEHICITADSDRETQVRKKSGVSCNVTR